jgi:hypothetical protein
MALRHLISAASIASLALLAPQSPALEAASPAAKPIPARLAPGVYHLGSKIPMQIALPLGTPAYFLEGDLVEGAGWGPEARIASVKQSPPTSFPGSLILNVEVQVFATGAVALPPLPLTLRTGGQPQIFKISVPAFAITPLLPADAQTEPPAAAVLALPRPLPWGWFLLGLAAALIVAALGWRVYRRRGLPEKSKQARSLRDTDPDRWILDEVNGLFLASLQPEERYTKLSRRLRDYLEIKTGQPFLEWTTSEVQQGLARMEDLPPGSATDLMGVLALCDWAAFARYRPERTEENDAKVRALRFLAAVRSPPESREGAA